MSLYTVYILYVMLIVLYSFFVVFDLSFILLPSPSQKGNYKCIFSGWVLELTELAEEPYGRKGQEK